MRILLLTIVLAMVGGVLLVASNLVPSSISWGEIRRLAVTGELSNDQQREVFRLLQDVQVESTGIDRIKALLEAVPWIESAAVERQWPDAMAITLAPEQPVALWNNDAFLNDVGEVFVSPFVNESRLPQLYGPAGDEREVMLVFQRLNNALFQAGQSIRELTLNERGAWSLTTDQGIAVQLGKSELLPRVQRLVRVIQHMSHNDVLGSVNEMDTRYSNGVAIGWKDSATHINLAGRIQN